MGATARELVEQFSVNFALVAGEHHRAEIDVVRGVAADVLFQPDAEFGKEVVLAALDEYVRLNKEFREMLPEGHDTNIIFRQPYKAKRVCRDSVEVMIRYLLRRKLKWADEELLDLLSRDWAYAPITPREVALQQIKKIIKPKGAKLGPGLLARLLELAQDPESSTAIVEDSAFRELLSMKAEPAAPHYHVRGLGLCPGEEWARVLVATLSAKGEGEDQAFLACYFSAREASVAKPSATWKKAATRALANVSTEALREDVLAAFRAVPKGRNDLPVDHDLHFAITGMGPDVLRGLTWLLGLDPWPGLGGELADLLVTSLKKLPWQGPRCIKLANACILGLGEMAVHKDEAIRMSGLAQLAKLKGRVTFKTTLKAIQKALVKAADAVGVSIDELEELGVPSFGFEGGRLERTVGGSVATLTVESSRVSLTWVNDQGKAVKSVPAAVRKEHGDEVKELKRIAKDAEAIVVGTKARLDSLYLRDASWDLGEWRQRYWEHGLVGPLAKRLIWSADGRPFLPLESGFVDALGASVEVTDSASIRLWHPISSDSDEVLAWRTYIEEAGLIQPFKQAHREVYLLTDAERQTSVYSNRFAAHIIKQHQFAALAKGRGWDYSLRLMVDASYDPPQRPLPAFGLRAEFWVEPVGDEYGADTTEAGPFLHLSTDQVRFYREGARSVRFHGYGGAHALADGGSPEDGPLAVDAIDPLVFSEIMRDADLFVGVTSVSNDPEWTDSGREPAQETYWHSASFGQLNATAETRKDLLSRLLPRLKIAGRCELEGRFLRVRGDRRIYKIHLGSGNILMEPNDQYLCIVPDAKARKAGAAKVFLPFEGDRTLSIVLSKAFLLAEDSKIDDPTIVSQIGR